MKLEISLWPTPCFPVRGSFVSSRCPTVLCGFLTCWALFSADAVRADEGAGWKFMVFGDSRGPTTSDPINTTILAELARATTNEKPAWVLFSGDFSYSRGLSELQTWTNIMAPVYEAGIKVYPVMGNHETNDVGAYLNVFGSFLPTNGPANEVGRTYAIAYSNVLVLALDDYVNAGWVNQAWIDSVLATNTQPHVFAMSHLPAFKVYHDGGLDVFPAARNAFWQSLSNAHCRIYFAGHDHFYDHMRLDDGDGNPGNDIHQIIVGTGGAPLYADGAYDGDNGLWTPVRVLHEPQYGYMLVAIDGDNVTATWHPRAGPDNYVAAADVLSYTVRPGLAFDFAGGGLTLTWTGGVLQTADDARGPYVDLPEAVSPCLITNFAAPRQFFRTRNY